MYNKDNEIKRIAFELNMLKELEEKGPSAFDYPVPNSVNMGKIKGILKDPYALNRVEGNEQIGMPSLAGEIKRVRVDLYHEIEIFGIAIEVKALLK